MSPVSPSEMPIVKNGATKAQAIPATDSAIPRNDLWLLRGSIIPLHSSLFTPPATCNYSHYTSAEQTCAKGSGLIQITELPRRLILGKWASGLSHSRKLSVDEKRAAAVRPGSACIRSPNLHSC